MVMDGVSVCLWRCLCLMLSKGGPVFWWWAARSVDGLPDLRTTCFQSCLVLGVWMRGTCGLWSHFLCGLLCEHHAQDTHWECEAFNCPHRLDQLCRAAADQPLCKHTLLTNHFKSHQWSILSNGWIVQVSFGRAPEKGRTLTILFRILFCPSCFSTVSENILYISNVPSERRRAGRTVNRPCPTVHAG